MVAGLAGSTYEERCQELNLETLEKRRWNQDMKQTFKIMRGIDKLDRQKIFKMRQENTHTRTADDPLHLRHDRSRLEVRTNSFTQRVITSWNNIGYENKSKSLARFKTALKRPIGQVGSPQ